MNTSKDSVGNGQQNITDPSQGKYFHIMLHMEDDDLGPHEYRLLGHYRRVCGSNGGTCWESTRTTSDKCKMSTGKVCEARQSLEKKKFIAINRDGKTLNITLVDRMPENVARYQSDTERVHNMNGGRSQYEQERSYYEPKNNHKKKNPIEEEKKPLLLPANAGAGVETSQAEAPTPVQGKAGKETEPDKDHKQVDNRVIIPPDVMRQREVKFGTRVWFKVRQDGQDLQIPLQATPPDRVTYWRKKGGSEEYAEAEHNIWIHMTPLTFVAYFAEIDGASLRYGWNADSQQTRFERLRNAYTGRLAWLNTQDVKVIYGIWQQQTNGGHKRQFFTWSPTKLVDAMQNLNKDQTPTGVNQPDPGKITAIDESDYVEIMTPFGPKRLHKERDADTIARFMQAAG